MGERARDNTGKACEKSVGGARARCVTCRSKQRSEPRWQWLTGFIVFGLVCFDLREGNVLGQASQRRTGRWARPWRFVLSPMGSSPCEEGCS